LLQHAWFISSGGRFGGFAFYVKNKQLMYEVNTGEAHDVVVSTTALPHGQVVVGYSLTVDADQRRDAPGGLLRVSVNGVLMKETKLAKVSQNLGPMGIGRSYKPISKYFNVPFEIGDAVKKVRVTLGDNKLTQPSRPLDRDVVHDGGRR
jgi:hypothetical protein